MGSILKSAGRRNDRSRKSKANYETLESRLLMAGDVQVFQQGSTLRVVGDGFANAIEITRNANGQTVVSGLDNTTINGNASRTIGTQRNLSVELKAGDDVVLLSDYSVRGDVAIRGHAGNDAIGVDGLQVDDLRVYGHGGNDVVGILDANIERSAYFYMRSGDDLVGINNTEVDRNLTYIGNGGDDTFAAGSLNVGRKIRQNLGSGADNSVFLDNLEVGRQTRINAGAGSDFVAVAPSQSPFNSNATANFNRRLSVKNGAGNDTNVIDANTAFRSNRLVGGAGQDTVGAPSGIARSGFESSNQNVASLTNQVMDRVMSGDFVDTLTDDVVDLIPAEFNELLASFGIANQVGSGGNGGGGTGNGGGSTGDQGGSTTSAISSVDFLRNGLEVSSVDPAADQEMNVGIVYQVNVSFNSTPSISDTAGSFLRFSDGSTELITLSQSTMNPNLWRTIDVGPQTLINDPLGDVDLVLPNLNIVINDFVSIV